MATNVFKGYGLSRSQQSELGNLFSKGKGGKYASNYGITGDKFKQLFSAWQGAGGMASGGGKRGDLNADWNGKWKKYNVGDTFDSQDIKDITKYYTGKGFSTIGANNQALKIASITDPTIFDKGVMNDLNNLNRNYVVSSENPGPSRTGTLGSGGLPYSKFDLDLSAATKGKKGGTAMLWDGFGNGLKTARGNWRYGGMTTFSNSGSSNTGPNGNRVPQGQDLPRWEPITGYRGKGGTNRRNTADGNVGANGKAPKASKGAKGGKAGDGGYGGGGDFDMSLPETPEMPKFATGSGTSGYRSAGGVRSKKSSWRTSGRALQGTGSLKINHRTTAYGGGI